MKWEKKEKILKIFDLIKDSLHRLSTFPQSSHIRTNPHFSSATAAEFKTRC